MYTIYQARNKRNNLYYVGCTSDYKERVYQHEYELKKNKHNNPLMQSDYNNGDRFVFSVIDTEPNIQIALEIEKEWISIVGHYNLKTGAKSARQTAVRDITEDKDEDTPSYNGYSREVISILIGKEE